MKSTRQINYFNFSSANIEISVKWFTNFSNLDTLLFGHMTFVPLMLSITCYNELTLPLFIEVPVPSQESRQS